MNWWSDLIDWMSTSENRTVLLTTGLSVVSILLAALIGAGVGRNATKRLVAQRDRESRANAVAALITAGTHAASWASQTPAAKDHSEQLASAADITVRLMPIKGAGMAADWAAHQLTDLRTNSVSYSFASDQSLREYRDRLLEWASHPRRAKKLFGLDLERWSYGSATPDPIYAEQTAWTEQRLPTMPAATTTEPLVPTGAGAPVISTRS